MTESGSTTAWRTACEAVARQCASRSSGESAGIAFASPALLNCEELSAAFERLGWFCADIDRAPVFNKATLLHAIYQSCSFPAYFGFNWDALKDCLTDFSWLPASDSRNGYVLIYKDPGLLRARAPEDLATFLDIIRDASNQWARQVDKPFRLLIPEKAKNWIP